MLKFTKTRLVAIFLVAASTSVFAQRGTVDCSQVIKSEILKRDMHYSVYLPDGYNTSSRSYPVLYLLHGMWDNYTGWVVNGEVNHVASEIITSGEAPEMIIVMPDGLIDAFYVNSYDKSVRWEDFFYKEFIPQVEAKYRINANRNSRAIAGLSMGGYGSLYHAFKHKDMFKACYAMSAAVIEVDPVVGADTRNDFDKNFQTKIWGPLNSEGFPTNYKECSIQEMVKAMPEYVAPPAWGPGSENAIPAITIDCGDDDFLFKQNSDLVLLMKNKKIPFEFRVRDGAHTWDYWRTSLPLCLKFVGDQFRN